MSDEKLQQALADLLVSVLIVQQSYKDEGGETVSSAAMERLGECAARLRATAKVDQDERDETADEGTRATSLISEDVWQRAAVVYCAERDAARAEVAALVVENTALRARYDGDLVERMRVGIMATEAENARLRAALRAALLYLSYAWDSPHVQPQSTGLAIAERDAFAALPEETQIELREIWAERDAQ